MERLFIVVRNDIDPGLQLAQSCHALSAYALERREDFEAWMHGGQNIVCLAARDLGHLESLRLGAAPAQRAGFWEPDLGGELTAVAFHEDAGSLLGALPLALRAKKEAPLRAAS